MRKTMNVVLFVAVAVSLLSARPAMDVSGTWSGQLKDPAGVTGNIRFVLKQVGDQISGGAGPSEKQTLPQIYEGKLEGDHLTFSVDDADDNGFKLTYHMDLTVTGDRIVGKANGRSGDRTWRADISVARQK